MDLLVLWTVYILFYVAHVFILLLKFLFALLFIITVVPVTICFIKKLRRLEMGKQKRKKHQSMEKVDKRIKICERCGNENFSYSKVFRCRFCNKLNGVGHEAD